MSYMHACTKYLLINLDGFEVDDAYIHTFIIVVSDFTSQDKKKNIISALHQFESTHRHSLDPLLLFLI